MEALEKLGVYLYEIGIEQVVEITRAFGMMTHEIEGAIRTEVFEVSTLNATGIGDSQLVEMQSKSRRRFSFKQTSHQLNRDMLGRQRFPWMGVLPFLFVLRVFVRVMATHRS